MGYTQYWNTKRDFTCSEWDKICTQTKNYLATIHDLVAGPLGDGDPIMDPDSIAFNGIGQNGSYESFNLERERRGYEGWMDKARYLKEGEFNFCKTAARPYDLAVVEVLKIAKRIAPECITLKSDGGSEVFQ